MRLVNKRTHKDHDVVEGGAELTAQRYSLQLLHNLPEQFGMRITFREGYPDPTDTEPDVCTDLEQLQTNGIALRLGHGGTLQPQTPQRLHQHIGER